MSKQFIFIKHLIPKEGQSFIRNGNIHSCISCKYFLPNDITRPEDNPGSAKCMKFGVKNIINDVILYDKAEDCRDDIYKCSKNAIFYEKNEHYH
jgi:hypothetical protein